jgi:uncharacterized membrane protein YdbT with pleckstrin-like domain
MADFIVHPSGRMQYFAIWAVFALFCAILILCLGTALSPAVPAAFALALAIAILLTASTYGTNQSKTLESDGDTMTYSWGIVSRKTMIVPLQKISGLTARQDFPENLFGLGSVFVDTAGGPDYEISMRHVDAAKLTVLMELFRQAGKANIKKDAPKEKDGKKDDDDGKDRW